MPDGFKSTVKAPLPTPPARQFSFTDVSTNTPTAQQPGDRMDAEYDRSNQATTELIDFVAVTFNTDGTLKPGTVGTAQLDPSIVADITVDIETQVQPLVDDAQAFAGAAASSSTTAQAAATAADTANTAAQGASGQATNSATQAQQSATQAQGYANQASTAQGAAETAANHADYDANLSSDLSLVCQAWAEHMPDPIPPNILAVMGITGDHWSSRWWATRAEAYFGGAITTLYLGAWPTPPATTPTGDPIPIGGLYYDTTTQQPYVWTGSEWRPFWAPTKALTLTLIYAAAANQTVVTTTTNDLAGNRWTFDPTTPEPVEVSVNGVRLPGSEGTYTGDWTLDPAHNTVTFSRPLPAGSVILVDVLTPPEALAPSAVTTRQLLSFNIDPVTGNPGQIDGVRTTFTLALADRTLLTINTPLEVLVFIDGVAQIPGTDYVPSSGGTTITFSDPPLVGAVTWGLHFTGTNPLTPGAGVYLPVAGGTMTGALTLAGPPSLPLNAASKAYVDAAIGGGSGPFLPISGGTLTGSLTLSGNAIANLQPVTLQQMNAANAGFLPTAGGQMSGPITPITSSNGHAVSENFPSLDFRGGNIAFYRNITNATANEVGANPKVFIQLDNNCANYTVQPWGGYDGPTALFVNATNWPNAAGSVVATWSQITSQGNHGYTAQDTAHYVRVIKTGQNSCWGIAIQHQDNTGLAPGAFATMGIENAMQINGPEPDPHVQFDATYSMRQGMSFIPSVNPTNTWTASTHFNAGTIVTGTPSGGVSTCYIAQNSGTTGATQPVWPASGTIVDGGITWQTGVAEACELGLAILIGGGRPQLPNTLIWTGIAFNHSVGNACIDTTLAHMTGTNSAALRMAPNQLIDFTGGGNNANKNRRTIGWSDFLDGIVINTISGANTTFDDAGGFTSGGRIRLAGQINWSGVTTGYSDTYLSIGRNAQGFNNINFITGSGGLTLFSTNGSGVISSPYATFGTSGTTLVGTLNVSGSGSTFANDLTVNGNLTAQGRTTLANLASLSGVTTGYSDTALTIGRNAAGAGYINMVTGSGGLSLYTTNGSGVISTPYATFTGLGISVGANKVVGPQIAGWGTSTGGARGSIAAATATLPQVAAALAQLLTDLKTHGLLGA